MQEELNQQKVVLVLLVISEASSLESTSVVKALKSFTHQSNHSSVASKLSHQISKILQSPTIKKRNNKKKKRFATI